MTQDNIPTTPLSVAGAPAAADPDEPAWIALEERLRRALAPRFVLLRKIGAGGMGAVFLAREPELARLVAVKVLAPQLARDERARARFLREAQSAAGIAHPNVVAIHAFGEVDDGTPYFVMQYATGESIGSRLAREGPVNSREVRRMLAELASALSAAHARGIVHRDVKPANVLYDVETGRVLITDFGIAAILATPGGSKGASLTGTGMLIGTPRYMSPEQAAAEPATDRSDVYALGLVVYELLTGAGPFAETSPMQLLAAHLRDTPPPPSNLRPGIDPEIEQIVLRCLAKDPSARPTASEIVRRLGAADAVLEWPPPGLASLHGALGGVTRALGAGSVLAATSFLAMLGLGAAPALRSSSYTAALLLGSALAVGFFAFGVWAAVRVAGATRRALTLGYGWVTIAETLADSRRDTGLLIAGLREYAGLEPEERDTLRRRRVVASLAALAASVAPMPMIVGFSWIASTELEGWTVAAVILGPALALVAVGFALRRRESARLASARARFRVRAPISDSSGVVVAAWRSSFDTVRSGQRLSHGARGRPSLARVGAIASVLAALTMIVCLIPVFYIGIAGSSLWLRMSQLGNVQAKLQIAETARPLILPPDTTISPLAAGRAVYLLQQPPGGFRASGHGFVEHPAIGPGALLPDTLPATAFTRSLFSPSGSKLQTRETALPGAPAPERILQYAAGGLAPDERRWLEELDRSPRWAHWRQFLRARRVDMWGARYVLPFPDSVTAWNVSATPLLEMKILAYTSIMRAALQRSRGERARGDTTLREIITAGFQLVDNASTLTEQLFGIVIVGIGHDALNTANTLDGRPPGAEWINRRNVVATNTGEGTDDSIRPVGIQELDPLSARRRVLQSVGARAVTRSIRMENYSYLSLAPCTNLRELFGGPDAEVRAALDRGRLALARFPSETALLDLFQRQPELPISVPPTSPLISRLIVRLSGTSAWALRNPRIAGCSSIIASDWTF